MAKVSVEINLDDMTVEWEASVKEVLGREINFEITRAAREEARAIIREKVRQELSQYNATIINEAVKRACATVIRTKGAKE